LFDKEEINENETPKRPVEEDNTNPAPASNTKMEDLASFNA